MKTISINFGLSHEKKVLCTLFLTATNKVMYSLKKSKKDKNV